MTKSNLKLEINSINLAIEKHQRAIVLDENVDLNTSAIVSARIYLEALTRVNLDAVRSDQDMRDIDELLAELKDNYNEKLGLFDKKPLFS